jgi:GNAT superfamily N-acetyltransferase
MSAAKPAVVAVTTALDLAQARDLRRSVLCGELNWPRELVEDPVDEASFLVLASLGPKPLGSARLARRGADFHIEVLAVLDRFRRQGLGRALVAALEQEARSAQARTILALTPPAQAPFFAHLGYAQAESKDGFLRMEKPIL